MAIDLEIYKLYKADGEDERLVLKVLDDCDLGRYIVTDATYGIKGGSSNLFRHVFEFPSYEVKKDDLVVLYTKTGKQHMNEAETSHFFYWGAKHNVWNDDHDSVTLIKVATWQRKKFGEIIQPAKK